MSAMERPLTEHLREDGQPLGIDEYEKAGGYQGLRKAILQMTPDEVLAEVRASNLRGRGGAGFPTGMKWSACATESVSRRPKYVISNSDEMEPGTFKDRLLMQANPHQLLEGLIICGYATDAQIGYLFLRWAYTASAKSLMRAVAEAYEKGYLGEKILGSRFGMDIKMHTSAGRYICGEETALLNALEGVRPIPRSRPPFPAQCGLWGRPTVVNNAETLSNVPHIIRNGAAWYKSLSTSPDGGTKMYGASGRVERPGLWELPMGTPIRELLEAHAGGMRDGYRLRGIIPGGASTDFLTEAHLDVNMDFDSMQKAGSRLGTGTMIILDDKTCPVGLVLNLERFFARESCGWCTPCREGLPWIVRILEAIEKGEGEQGDLDVLEWQAQALGPGKTYCVHAPGAVEPLQSALKYFRDDFEQHIKEKKCPWRRKTG
jgi:NADH-quinone oxidoreductase subunit F